MARKSLPSNAKSHNGYSADEFQRQLLNWFQDRGLLSDLQAHLRHQMIVALRDTSLNINSAGSFHQAGSPKLQAINLLVAEFLLRQECHYTLSVFTSEVPLLRNLPEFSNALQNGGTVGTSGSDDRFPGFHERDVFDILEALGFGPNSEETQRINDLYEHSHGESLLTCVIRTLPDKFRGSVKAVGEKCGSPEPRNKEQQLAILQQSPLFTEEIQNLILELDVGSQQIAQLHNALKRIIEEEVEKIQKEEEKKFRSMLLGREQRIQGIWKQYDEKIQEKLVKAEEKLKEKQAKVNQEINQKQTHLAILASELRQQQNEVANRLNYVQERNELLEQKEIELRVLKKESEEYIFKEQQKLEEKEKQIEQQLLRLDVETQAREQERRELEANRIQIEQASRAIRESQSEIAMLRDLQKQHSLTFKALEEEYRSNKHRPESQRRKKSEWTSQAVQVNLNKQKGAIPKVHNVQQQTNEVPCEDQALQTQISGSDMDDVFMHLRAQSSENERRRSQHTMMNNMIDHLEQENSELRGHIAQQRLRIEELTLQSSRLMHHLNEVNTSLTRLRSESTNRETDQQGVQTSPQTPRETDSSPARTRPARNAVPSVNMNPVTPPPPLPPPVASQAFRAPFRGFVRSNQLGAGEESYFSRRLPPDSYIPLYSSTHREHRRKPLRRLMVHSFSSSEESSPSPTEDMLHEARRRLRRLEEETAAVDRNYQEFRLRQVDSLTNTASILFQPVPSDLSAMSAPQSISARQKVQKAPNSLPPSLSRSRFSRPQVTLVNQVPSANLLQPGVINTAYVYSSRATEQARQLHSDPLQSRSTLNPPTQFAEEHLSVPASNSWGKPNPSMVQSSTLSSKIPLKVHSSLRSPRDVMNLPAAFSFNEPSRHQPVQKEKKETDHLANQPSPSSSRLQELPPCIVSVPHIPVSVLDSGTVVNQRSQLCDDKPRVTQPPDGRGISPQRGTWPDTPSSTNATLQFEVIKEVPGKRVSDNFAFRPFQNSMYPKGYEENFPITDSSEHAKGANNTTIAVTCVNKSEKASFVIEGSSSEPPKVPLKGVGNEDKAVADLVSEHSTGDSVTSLMEGDRTASKKEGDHEAKESCATTLKQGFGQEVARDAADVEGPKELGLEVVEEDSSPVNPVEALEEVLVKSDPEPEKPIDGEVSVNSDQKLMKQVEFKEINKSSEEPLNSKDTREIITPNKETSSDLLQLSALHIESKELDEIVFSDILVPSLGTFELQQLKGDDQSIDNVKERSRSPSSPSILGSSKEVSSDVISAGSVGEEKSDNSW